ncbi:unnamed protein product [Protopolystoma xenopodis]|uniref:Uncharacterized protein n=1 Tax=Protopolystoma xenopodis TaxID=117903 RepID=A0A448XFZ9_9PLAT|nr:unnamed protein product [Protopolystoma xenopodis]
MALCFYAELAIPRQGIAPFCQTHLTSAHTEASYRLGRRLLHLWRDYSLPKITLCVDSVQDIATRCGLPIDAGK